MSDCRWNAATRPAVPGDHVVGICKGGHDSSETPCEYQPITEADVLELVEAVAAAQAEARELRERAEKAERNYQWMVERAADQHLSGYRELARRAADAENVADGLRAGLARVKTLSATWREQAQALAEQQEAECDPDIASVLEATGDQLETCAEELDAALSPAPEPILSTCPVCGDPDDHEHDSMAAPAPELPLMARDTCTNCGGTGVGGYHVHAPQEDAVEALRCEACDGFGFIEHGPKDCPATAPELPLMARREWRESVAFATVNQGAITGVFDRYDAAARSATHHRACIYRIADTDEHGLPVIERAADMPKRAKYRIRWITQADAAGGEVEYTDSLPLALEANRSGAVSERIEDYRPAAQESGDASD